MRSRPLRPIRPSNATHNKSTSEAASIEYQTPQSRPFALASVRFCSQAVALRGLAYVRGGRPLPLFSHSAARSAPSPGVCPDGCTHGHARRDPDPRSEPRARPSPCRGAARRRVADACRGAASVVGRRSGGWAARRVLHTTNLSTLKHQHINTVPLVSDTLGVQNCVSPPTPPSFPRSDRFTARGCAARSLVRRACGCRGRRAEDAGPAAPRRPYGEALALRGYRADTG